MTGELTLFEINFSLGDDFGALIYGLFILVPCLLLIAILYFFKKYSVSMFVSAASALFEAVCALIVLFSFSGYGFIVFLFLAAMTAVFWGFAKSSNNMCKYGQNNAYMEQKTETNCQTKGNNADTQQTSESENSTNEN